MRILQDSVAYEIPLGIVSPDAKAEAEALAAPIPGESLVEGVMIEPTPLQGIVPLPDPDSNLSWVYVIMLLLFVTICMRYRKNTRYLNAIFSDLTEVRERHNAFDNTVNETGFMILVNIGWILSTGVLLWVGIEQFNPGLNFYMPHSILTGLCAGIMTVYALLSLLAYYVVGIVFSDRLHTSMWIKGATASRGLEVLALFPLALMALCLPIWGRTLVLIALAVVIMGKILFIWKGFRIFFMQIASWLLFLYYLCSLEIIPLILTYLAALKTCTLRL